MRQRALFGMQVIGFEGPDQRSVLKACAKWLGDEGEYTVCGLTMDYNEDADEFCLAVVYA